MRKICIALIVASLLVAGCSKPEDKFVGVYEGEAEADPALIEAMQAASPAGSPQNMAEILASTTRQLKLYDDLTYTMTSHSMHGDTEQVGTWSIVDDGATVLLSAPTMPEATRQMVENMGYSPDDSIPLVVLDDGNVLLYEDTFDGLSLSIKYTRRS